MLAEYLVILKFYDCEEFDAPIQANPSPEGDPVPPSYAELGVSLIRSCALEYFRLISLRFSHHLWTASLRAIFLEGHDKDIFLDVLIALFDSFKILGGKCIWYENMDPEEQTDCQKNTNSIVDALVHLPFDSKERSFIDFFLEEFS